MKLSDFKALSFDCYGTLIDWESGIIAGTKQLAGKAGPDLSHDAILETHARYESEQQSQTPAMRYRDILSIVYRRMAEEWYVPVGWEECTAYGRSVEDWPAFADSAPALQYLKQHFKLIILSNIDNQSFAASNVKLGVAFDAIYSAEDIGSYKPADRNFTYMIEKLDALGLEKDEILHTAESMFHDHAPANRHGLRNCWIYRRHDRDGFGATMNPGEMPSYDFQFTGMSEMAEAHRRQQSG